MTPDEELLKDISGLSKSKKRKTKSECIEENLKNNVLTTNIELRDAYYEWIESVIQKRGMMTTAAVSHAQPQLDEFSNRDLDVALAVLKIASIHGYEDITWAINTYKKDHSKPVYSTNTFVTRTAKVESIPRCQRLSDEVF